MAESTPSDFDDSGAPSEGRTPDEEFARRGGREVDADTDAMTDDDARTDDVAATEGDADAAHDAYGIGGAGVHDVAPGRSSTEEGDDRES